MVELRSTFPDREGAQHAAAELVGGRLVACAQVGGPISSTYRWEGQVEHAEEWVLSVRTVADRIEEVIAAVRSLHPYDVPEVVVTPVIGGHRDYLDWVAAESSPRDAGD